MDATDFRTCTDEHDRTTRHRRDECPTETYTEAGDTAYDAQSRYNRACMTAADNQGLLPFMAALDAAKVPYDLEQTGGFCMVVTVATGPLAEEPGVFGVIASDDDVRPWLAVWYPGTSWTDGDWEEHGANFTTDGLLELLVNQTRT